MDAVTRGEVLEVPPVSGKTRGMSTPNHCTAWPPRLTSAQPGGDTQDEEREQRRFDGNVQVEQKLLQRRVVLDEGGHRDSNASLPSNIFDCACRLSLILVWLHMLSSSAGRGQIASLSLHRVRLCFPGEAGGGIMKTDSLHVVHSRAWSRPVPSVSRREWRATPLRAWAFCSRRRAR